MAKLLVIADDCTGAFDTGVQFAARGAVTTVVTDPACDMRSIGKAVEVLVVVTETRHLQPQEAYEIVFHTVDAALQAGIDTIYKKTDSALRGNVGSELTALMDAAGAETICFFPSLPKLNRITKGGVQYIDGVPVALSVFGQDPFDPVLDSAVADILGRQTAVPVVVHPRKQAVGNAKAGIQVFDAETDEDLTQLGRQLGLQRLQICAGCAGFAAVLADLLDLKGQAPEQPVLENPLLITCGSVNPVSINQMKAAQDQGIARVHLSPVQKLEASWVHSDAAGVYIQKWITQLSAEKCLILDANDSQGSGDTETYAREQGLTPEQLRVRISDNLAALIKRMLDEGLKATLLCTGGDTLLAFMRSVGVSQLTPICDLDTGVVLTEFVYREKTYPLITKSGGFGKRNLFVELAGKISGSPQ